MQWGGGGGAVEYKSSVRYILEATKLNIKTLPVILKFNKSVSILDNYVSDAAVAFEEPLQLTFTDIIGNISYVDSLATRHLAQGSLTGMTIRL